MRIKTFHMALFQSDVAEDLLKPVRRGRLLQGGGGFNFHQLSSMPIVSFSPPPANMPGGVESGCVKASRRRADGKRRLWQRLNRWACPARSSPSPSRCLSGRHSSLKMGMEGGTGGGVGFTGAAKQGGPAPRLMASSDQLWAV